MKTIPKIIHYVWIGKTEKNKIALHCIKSWKKYCPDYQIVEWNEENFNVASNKQVKKALKEENWAYAADIIRVWALKEFGGVYLDTDVELIKNLDTLLNNELFLCYESKYWFGSAVIGAIKAHPAIELIFKRYQNDKKIKFNTNPLTVHSYSASLKLLYDFKPQGKKIKHQHFLALPSDYFYPINYLTLRKTITSNTYGIHYYQGSWHDSSQKRSFKFIKIIRKIFGKQLFSCFEKMVAYFFYRTLKKELNKFLGEK